MGEGFSMWQSLKRSTVLALVEAFVSPLFAAPPQRWLVRIGVASNLILSPVVSFSADKIAPDATEALTMPELRCENSVLGISSASSDPEFPATQLCMRSSRCTVATAFNYRSGQTTSAWSKGDWFLLTYECQTVRGQCPSASECAREAFDENTLHRWAKATTAATSILATGEGRVCRYANPIEPRYLVRSADKDWKKTDAVCASTVTCDPAMDDQVAVCKPRKADLAKWEVECPSAMDCVAERFPLDKPKK
jgi:hypothetical protein